MKYYIGKNREITSLHFETFIIRTGDKISIITDYTNTNTVFCNHKKGPGGIMIYNNEIGDIKELRYNKLQYIEKYY